MAAYFQGETTAVAIPTSFRIEENICACDLLVKAPIKT
ncbi:uncharacterized protein METZ01_LOCUS489224, partial [marine metagenome]